jgi:ATP-dependent phosphofructokinase / diphosphate-dependent phosphofructokinase
MPGNQKTIGILTGGGDVPGLNPAIRAITIRALREGYRVVGIRRGWAGLVDYVREKDADNSDNVQDLSEAEVNRAGRSGGTFLHTSRTRPSHLPLGRVPKHYSGYTQKTNDITKDVLKNLEHIGIDVLVPIGGDDTLSYGKRLHDEGMHVVAIPKTMDNDVFGTDYCLGFSTAVTRSVMFINDLRTSAGSHERFLVVELFGRHSGETCLLASYLSGADRAVIAEVPFDCERLYRLLCEDKRDNPSNYAVVAVSEGATVVGGGAVESGEADAFGNRRLGGIGGVVSDFLENQGRDKVIYQRLAYLMRSGAPDSLDQLVANNYGSLAADLLRRGEAGKMVAVVDGRYTAVPIEVGGAAKKRVDVERFYDAENYRPKVADVMGMPMFLH